MVDKFRTADEVMNDREERRREEFKQKLGKDISEIFENILPEKTKRKFSILKWMGILFLMLFLLTLVLGCVFLLKFFIKGIF